jgi:hypothetical protein
VPPALVQTPFSQERPTQHPSAQASPAFWHAVHTSFAHVPLQHSLYVAQTLPPSLQAAPLVVAEEVLLVDT